MSRLLFTTLLLFFLFSDAALIDHGSSAGKLAVDSTDASIAKQMAKFADALQMKLCPGHSGVIMAAALHPVSGGNYGVSIVGSGGYKNCQFGGTRNIQAGMAALTARANEIFNGPQSNQWSAVKAKIGKQLVRALPNLIEGRPGTADADAEKALLQGLGRLTSDAYVGVSHSPCSDIQRNGDNSCAAALQRVATNVDIHVAWQQKWKNKWQQAASKVAEVAKKKFGKL